MSAIVERKFVWATLTIVSLGSFAIVIDSYFLNVAITTLVSDLHTTVTFIEGIIAVYALTIACVTLLGAKLQNVLGRKKTFLYGAAIFGVGTTITALSLNALMLLFGWSLLQGVGAALMRPGISASLNAAYKGNERAFAFGLWTAIGAMAMIAGPLLGGFLATFLSWRVGFGLVAVIVVVIFAFSGRLIESQPTIGWRDLDLVGFVLSAASFFMIVTGALLLNGQSGEGLVPIFFGAGLLLLALFALWQRRRLRLGLAPLTDISLFRKRAYSAGNVANLIMRLGLAGMLFILPVFLQTEMGLSAFMTGVAFVPLTVAVLVFALASGRLSAFIAPRYLVPLGFLIALAGSILLRNAFSMNTQIVDIIPGAILFGAGAGLSFALLSDIILSSASKEEHEADASGVFSTTSKLGDSLGTALIGAILVSSTFAALSPAIEKAYSDQLTVHELKEKLPAWVHTLKTTNLQLVRADHNKTTRIVNETISDSMQYTVDSISVFLFVGFISSLFIGRRKHAPQAR